MKVYFRGKRDALRRKIYQLAAVLAGRQADEHGIAKAFSLGIGQELLNNVHNDYDKMALGQRGEMGYQWQPLSPYTLEHRRGVTKPNPKNIAKYNQWQKDGKQKDYQDAYTKRYEEMLDTLTLTGRGRSDPATIAIAREVATTYATTLIKDTEDIKRKQAYGNVKILIDIGTLYNSLAPGVIVDGNYTVPGTEGGDQQIMRLNAGSVTVGTKVPYGIYHQNGAPNRKPPLPRRPFLPIRGSDIPQAWWSRMLQVAQESIQSAMARYFS